MRTDPNPFPETGVVPLWCTSLRPGTRERRWDWFDEAGAIWDEEAAQKILRWFKHLKHTQGPLAGKPFKLTPEQTWLMRETFGWKNRDGWRIFRICYVEMGRGNGKSQLGAAIAGYLLLADGETDPEVIGAAANRDQARKYCYNRLKAMAEATPQIAAKLDMYRKVMNVKKGNGFYEAVSADVTSAWGGAPHGIIFDEVHAQPGFDLWDAFETAMGKRSQPMMWGWTTAGWDKNSLCWTLHERVRQISQSVIEDSEFFGIIWAADEDDDWTDPEVWRKANPMMGEAFTEEFIRAKCEKAKNTPTFQNTFRTMYLSQWVGQEVRFLDMTRWDAGAVQTGAPSKSRQAFGGLDLSSTTDLSAFALAARNGEDIDLYVKFYAPAEGLHERSRRDRLPYEVWARDGILTLTPGATIDQDVIKADILAAKEAWDLEDVSYDRWNASKVVKELEEEGVTMVQVGQGFAGMSAPAKFLLRLVTDQRLHHDGNPLLRANASVTAAVIDAAENIKPDKALSGGRIDGIVASIMALDGQMRRGRDEPKRSMWEDENWEEEEQG